jgi:TRAP-type C4-dicarboxylate transport system permease small subunit
MLLYYIIAIIPALIVTFFFISLAWSYWKYSTVKAPTDTPTTNKEIKYLSDKLTYFEDGIISAGFIVIFLLITISVPLYKIMYKVDKKW